MLPAGQKAATRVRGSGPDRLCSAVVRAQVRLHSWLQSPPHPIPPLVFPLPFFSFLLIWQDLPTVKRRGLVCDLVSFGSIYPRDGHSHQGYFHPDPITSLQFVTIKNDLSLV